MLGIDLEMPVRTLLVGPVARCEPLTTLRGAASVLATEMIGALLVGQASDPVGIFSERDLAQAVADGADTDDERVRDFMSEDLETIGADAPLREAARIMLADEIRHLIVVDDHGRTLGVVSMRDVMAAAMEEAEQTSV